MRLNPLNLPKVVYFDKGSKGSSLFPHFIILQSVDDPNPYNFKDKGSLYITRGLQALRRTLPSGAEKTVKVDKVRYVASS